ncbi:hypothetical protein [Candidatus Fukatsuia endosymbiont of Tuberolachnus salignus]|uniref:hypothetical protein n=1 Tax=Candidatus Fukatsuia endosymbiont of Tuberolachnus salignus TaxID=3077957 RepID=UPI00313B425B
MSTETGAAKCTTPFAVEFTGAFRSPYLPYRLSVSISVKYSAGAAEGEKQGRVIPHPEKQSQLPETPHLAARTSPEPSFTDQGTQTDLPTEPHQPVVPPKAHKSPAVSSSMSEKNVIESKPSEASANKEETQSAKPSTDDKSTFTDPVGVVEKKQHRFLRMIWRFFQGILHKNPSKSEPIVSEKSGTEVEEISGGTSTAREVSSKSVQTSGTVPQMHPTNSRKGGTLQTSRQNGLDSEIHYPRSRSRSVSKEKLVVKMPEERKQPQPTALKKNIKTKSVGTSTLSNSKDASTSVDDLVPAKEHKSVGTSTLSNSKDASTSVDDLVPAKEHKSVGTSMLSNSKDASTSVDGLVPAKEHKSVGTSTLSNSKDASTSVDDLVSAKEHKSVGTSTLSNSKDASTSVDDLEPAKEHKSVGTSTLSNSKDASTSVDDLEPAKEHKSVGASMLSNSKDASTSVDDLEPAKEHKSVGASMLSNSKDASTSVDDLEPAKEHKSVGASMLSNSKDASTSVDDLEPAKEHKSVGASMLSNSKDASTSVDGLVTAEEKQEIETPKIDEKTLVEMPGEQNGSESSESVLSKGDSVNGAPVLRQDPQDPKQQGAGWMTAGIRPETEEITSVVAKASKASTQTESTVAISGARTFSLDFSELNKLLSAPYSYDPTSELAPKLPIESNDHVSAEDSFLKDKMAEIVASINKQAELFDSINDENKRLELQDLFFDTTRRIATEQQGLRKIAEQYSLESIEAVIKSLAKEIYKDGLSPKSLSHGNTQSKYIETVSKPAIEAANQAPSRESEEVPKIVPETTSMLPLAPEQADIETQSELSSDKLFSESAVILGAEKKTYADGFVTPKRHRGAKNTAASSFAMQQESTLEISSKAREPSVQLQKGKPSELESKDRFGVLESEEFQTRLNPSVSGQAEPSEETLSLQEVVTHGQEKSLASSESGMMQVMLSPEKMREIKEIDVVGNPHIFTAIKQIDPFNGKKPEVYLLKSENDTVPFIIKKSEEGKLSLDFYGENVVTSVIGDNIDELKSKVKELAKHYGIGQLGGFDIYKVNVQAVTGTMSKPALEANQPSSETVQEEKPTILSVQPSPDAARVSDIPLVLPPKTNSASLPSQPITLSVSDTVAVTETQPLSGENLVVAEEEKSSNNVPVEGMPVSHFSDAGERRTFAEVVKENNAPKEPKAISSQANAKQKTNRKGVKPSSNLAVSSKSKPLEIDEEGFVKKRQRGGHGSWRAAIKGDEPFELVLGNRFTDLKLDDLGDSEKVPNDGPMHVKVEPEKRSKMNPAQRPAKSSSVPLQEEHSPLIETPISQSSATEPQPENPVREAGMNTDKVTEPTVQASPPPANRVTLATSGENLVVAEEKKSSYNAPVEGIAVLGKQDSSLFDTSTSIKLDSKSAKIFAAESEPRPASPVKEAATIVEAAKAPVPFSHSVDTGAPTEISSGATEHSVQLQKGKPSKLESKNGFGVLGSEELQTRLNPSVSGQAEPIIPSEETLSLQKIVTNGQEKSLASSESGMMQVMLSPEKMRKIKEIDVVGNPHIFTAIKQIDPFNGKKPEVYLLKSKNDTVPFIIKKSEEGKLSLDFYGENVVTSVIGDNIDELKSRVKELAKHYGIGQLGGFDIYKVNVQAVTGTMSKPALEANQPSSEVVQDETPTILSVGPSPDAARVSDIPLVLPPKTNSASPQSILSQAEKIPTTAPETTSTLSQKSPVFPLWNEPTESEKTSIGERGVEGFETMPIAVPEESDDQLLARMLAPDPDLDRMLANIQMSQMAPKFSSYLKDRITRLERSIFQKEGILSKGYNDLARLNNESLYSQTVQKLQLHSRELKYRSEEQAFQLLDSGSETLRNAIEYLQKNPDKVVPAISPEEKQQAQQFVTDPRRNSYDAIQSIKNFGEAPQEAARDVRLLKYEIKLIEEYKTKLIAEWNELNSLRPEDEISSQIDTMKAESGENASALNHTTEVTQTANTSLSDAKSKELTKLLETVFGQYEEMLLTADQNLADVELETDNPADPKLVIENSNKRGHIQKWHKVKLEVTKKIEELKSDLERVSKGEYPLLPFLASEPDFKPYYQILPDNREFNSEIKKPAKEKTDWNKLYILHDEKINGINELLILIEKNKESLLENKEKIIKLEGETKDSLIIEERHKLKEKNQEVMVLQKEYRDGNESIEKLKRDLLSTDEIALYLDEKIAKYQPVLEEKMGTLTAEKQLSTIESIKEIIGSMADYTDHSQTKIYNGIYNNISALQGDKTVKNIQEILCDRLEIKKCKMIQENIGALEDQRANLEIKIIDIQKKRDSLDINISTLDDEELAREAEIKKCRATIEEINNTIKIQNIKLEELRVSKEELEQEIDNAQEKLGNESDQPKSEPVGPWWYPS